jgi:hypothetical protein
MARAVLLAGRERCGHTNVGINQAEMVVRGSTPGFTLT